MAYANSRPPITTEEGLETHCNEPAVTLNDRFGRKSELKIIFTVNCFSVNVTSSVRVLQTETWSPHLHQEPGNFYVKIENDMNEV